VLRRRVERFGDSSALHISIVNCGRRIPPVPIELARILLIVALLTMPMSPTNKLLTKKLFATTLLGRTILLITNDPVI
jgi:hypothetical protein